MKTIVIASQKGGSAKTTLTALLSVEAERAGDGPIWIIDTDAQGSLSRWHGIRETQTPERMELPFKDLETGLQAINAKHRGAYCFIDTAPTLSEQNIAIMKLADLVLIPVQPSPVDAWAVADTIEEVKKSGKSFRFVVTKAKAQATVTAQTIAMLSAHGTVFKTFIPDRVLYATAMTGGNTAPELFPKGPAAMETASLWNDIKAVFQQNSKVAKKVHHG
jgi:chromosome partitioning protein